MPKKKIRMNMVNRVLGVPVLDGHPSYSIHTRFFLRSDNADRKMSKLGDFNRGVWVEVPFNVYNPMKKAIEAGVKNGEDLGWSVKIEDIPVGGTA